MNAPLEKNLFAQADYDIADLLNLLEVGLIILNSNAQITLWNEWMAGHSGVTPDEAIGKKLDNIFPELGKGRILVAIEQATQFGMSALLSTTFNKMPFPLAKRDKQGTTVHQIKQLVTIKALPDSYGSYNCLIQVIDVTNAERREQIMRDQAKELQQSNADLSQFAYIVSHDLQEPLRAIRNFGGLLEDEYGKDLPEEGRSHLTRITKGADRLQSMVSDVLSYSNISQDQRSFNKVNLNELIQDLMIELNFKLKETNATIDLDTLPEVYGNYDQLLQLFQNLISNSLKFTKAGVTPNIRISQYPASHPNNIGIQISDNGIGFEQKYAERIFNMSERLHNRKHFPGNGIGLAVCYRIVERHKGKITATSKLGEGSTFKIELPVKELSQEVTAKSS